QRLNTLTPSSASPPVWGATLSNPTIALPLASWVGTTRRISLAARIRDSALSLSRWTSRPFGALALARARNVSRQSRVRTSPAQPRQYAHQPCEPPRAFGPDCCCVRCAQLARKACEDSSTRSVPARAGQEPTNKP